MYYRANGLAAAWWRMQIAMMHKLMDKGMGSEQGWMVVHDVFSFFNGAVTLNPLNI